MTPGWSGGGRDDGDAAARIIGAEAPGRWVGPADGVRAPGMGLAIRQTRAVSDAAGGLTWQTRCGGCWTTSSTTWWSGTN